MSFFDKQWFEKFTNVVTREFESLTSRGIDYETNDYIRDGYLELYFHLENAGIYKVPDFEGKISVRVVFPDDYPFFRPEVYADELSFSRHQNPKEHNLCLLVRTTEHWRPEWTIGRFLEEQFPKIVERVQIDDPKVLENIPDEQAEPYSEYICDNVPILFDTSYFDESFTKVDQISIIGHFTAGVPNKVRAPTRMIILEVFDHEEKLVYRLPDIVSSPYERKLKGVILRLPLKPPLLPEEFLHKLVSIQKERKKQFPRANIPLAGGYKLEQVVCLNFPEEIAAGVDGSGWAFFVNYTIRNSSGRVRNKLIPVQNQPIYCKVARTNRQDYEQRAPRIRPLANKSACLIGLGAIGAPVAIDLARNGLRELRVLDHDFVDPGTTIRWPLGIECGGEAKTEALNHFVQKNYPRTNVVSFNYRIGSMKSSPDERQRLKSFFSKIDLIIDASAEIGVNNFLSAIARSEGIPYIMLSATEGGYGGYVLRVTPNTEGCWMCFQYLKGSAELPFAPAEKNGRLQTVGCGDTTFTGASFDLQNISLAATRIAVSTLCRDSIGGYPEMNYDVASLKLFDDQDLPVLPHWSYAMLKKHPLCPYCNDIEN